MYSIPLQEFVQATADVNGRAVGQAGPSKFGEEWDISLINIQCTSGAQTEFRVYRGIESDTTQILSTYSGNNDTAGGGSNIRLKSSEKLVFVWSKADAGAISTVRIEGELLTQRR